MATQCTTCGGIYEPVGADGCAYFHTCPPITYAAVVRNGKAGLVSIQKLAADDLITVERDGAAVQIAAGNMLPGDVRLGDVSRPRPNARNENVTTAIVDGARTPTIIAEGAGAVELPAIAPIVAPPVLDGTDQAIAAPPA